MSTDSKAKYTPGPWVRDKESGFDCDVRAANGRKIASVNVQCMPRTKQQFDGRKAENNANAYLIAAAPELLEALQESVQIFEFQSQMHRLVSRRAKGIHGIAVDDDVLAIEWQSLRAIADCMIVRRDKVMAKALGENNGK